jgi:hypothetical protein
MNGAPGLDFDGQGRPQGAGIDRGADEVEVAQATFPTTGLLDDFNRSPNNGSVGGNWSGDKQTNRFSIVNQEVLVQGNGGSIWWNPSTFGANQEAYYTLRQVSPLANEQALMLKLNGNPNNSNSSLVEVRYDAMSQTVQVWSMSPANGWVLRGAFAHTLADGDVLGGRVQTNGTVSIFVNGGFVGSANLRSGPTPWSETYISGGGQLGVRFMSATSFDAPNNAIFDDFSGGTMP